MLTLAAAEINPPEPVRILIVEPHPFSRRVLTELVSGWGMAVTDCSGMVEALRELQGAALNGTRYQAVIGGASIEESGEPLGAAIRADSKLSGTVLIAVGGADERAEWLASYDTCILKPMQARSLLDAIRRGCSKQRMAREMAAPGLRTTRRVAYPSFHLRALIAEDNSVNQLVARVLLQRLGCIVDIAVNGIEAIERWRTFPYDVIFMDCQMPELDGYDATRAIRAQSGIPIIAMTANARPGAREECFAAGMTGYIAKPIRIEDLSSALQTVAFSVSGQPSKGD